MFRTSKNYYPQVFLKESEYIVKEKKIPRYIIDDIEVYDSDKENSDEENKKHKEIFLKKRQI